MNKCKQCNAVVNPKWKKCFACGLSLNVIKQNELPIISEQIGNITLQEFTEKNLAIKVYSEVLGKEVWMVSNEKIMNQLKGEELAIYLSRELEYLIKLKATPEEVKQIQIIKEIFPGSDIVWN